jgi:hypothetical protein
MRWPWAWQQLIVREGAQNTSLRLFLVHSIHSLLSIIRMLIPTHSHAHKYTCMVRTRC